MTTAEDATAGVPFPAPLVYVAAFAVAVGLELLIPTPDLPLRLAIAVGAVGLLAWAALDPFAMRRFRTAGTEVAPSRPSSALVTDGPYRFSRNPMYLGMLILLVTLGLAVGVLWVLVLGPLVVLVIHRLVIRREEAYLERRFGERYQDYRRQVRPWL